MLPATQKVLDKLGIGQDAQVQKSLAKHRKDFQGDYATANEIAARSIKKFAEDYLAKQSELDLCHHVTETDGTHARIKVKTPHEKLRALCLVLRVYIHSKRPVDATINEIEQRYNAKKPLPRHDAEAREIVRLLRQTWDLYKAVLVHSDDVDQTAMIHQFSATHGYRVEVFFKQYVTWETLFRNVLWDKTDPAFKARYNMAIFNKLVGEVAPGPLCFPTADELKEKVVDETDVLFVADEIMTQVASYAFASLAVDEFIAHKWPEWEEKVAVVEDSKFIKECKQFRDGQLKPFIEFIVRKQNEHPPTWYQPNTQDSVDRMTKSLVDIHQAITDDPERTRADVAALLKSYTQTLVALYRHVHKLQSITQQEETAYWSRRGDADVRKYAYHQPWLGRQRRPILSQVAVADPITRRLERLTASVDKLGNADDDAVEKDGFEPIHVIWRKAVASALHLDFLQQLFTTKSPATNEPHDLDAMPSDSAHDVSRHNFFTHVNEPDVSSRMRRLCSDFMEELKSSKLRLHTYSNFLCAEKKKLPLQVASMSSTRTEDILRETQAVSDAVDTVIESETRFVGVPAKATDLRIAFDKATAATTEWSRVSTHGIDRVAMCISDTTHLALIHQRTVSSAHFEPGGKWGRVRRAQVVQALREQSPPTKLRDLFSFLYTLFLAKPFVSSAAVVSSTAPKRNIVCIGDDDDNQLVHGDDYGIGDDDEDNSSRRKHKKSRNVDLNVR